MIAWVTDLLGRRVEVRTFEGWDPASPDGRLVARGVVRGIGTVRDLPTLVLEVEYAGGMGGTLGMVPYNYAPVTDGYMTTIPWEGYIGVRLLKDGEP